MSREKKYDATFKRLLDARAPDWVPYLCRRLNLPPGLRAKALEADVSTVSAQADKIFSLADGAAGYMHLEAQVSRDVELPDRTLLYSVLYENKVGGPVYSVALLLRREADAPEITGVLERRDAAGRVYLRFEYAVVRVWELPCDELLAAGLGMLPLALLTDDARPRLPELMARAEQELRRQALPPKAAGEFWTYCRVLMGLRYNRETVRQLFRGVTGMRESTTYMEIFEEGEAEGGLKSLRRAVRLIGERRFGTPPPDVDDRLNAVGDVDRLLRMNGRAVDAADWDELLNTP